MSETARELLVRGVAAAKTGQARDREEARFYLEWVLRSDDAASDQKASAWLWLSQIEDDPQKKRDCLENVLGWDPANGPARRGLAILDGRLKPEDIIDPDKPIVVVCRSGNRSATACALLSRQGFTQVYNLAGGVTAWRMCRPPWPNRSAASHCGSRMDMVR